MKHICKSTIASLVFMTVLGCSPQDTANPIVKQDPIPQSFLSVNATHAFDVPAPVKEIAFSPNDVASWLGVIAILTQNGHLMTTSIEGSAPKSVDMNTYHDVIGLNRSGKPAAFLALTAKGDLKSFIEADDESNFKAIPTTSDLPALKTLCDTPKGVTNQFIAVTTDGALIKADVTIDGAATLASGQELGRVSLKETKTIDCVFQGDTVYVLSDDELTKLGHKSIKISQGNGLTIVPKLNGFDIAISKKGLLPLIAYDSESLSDRGYISVDSGLSIGGIESALSIASTQAPFGGSAFNDGIIVMSDAHDNRLVVLSQSYLNGKL